MLRQLKTTDSLINSDEVAWNLAISEANLCRGSTKHSFYKTFLKNFVKFTEKDLCQNLFFKTFCNFKRRLWHKCFKFWNLLRIFFLQNALRSLLLLLEKSLIKYTKPTTRMLVQQFKNTCGEICFSKFSDLYRELTFLGSIIQQLFSLNILNTFSWLLLIIYTNSVIFISHLL